MIFGHAVEREEGAMAERGGGKREGGRETDKDGETETDGEAGDRQTEGAGGGGGGDIASDIHVERGGKN